MNIFKNTVRSVEPLKCIAREYTDIDKISESAATNAYFRELEKKEKAKCECEKQKACEEKAKSKETVDAVVMKSLTANKIIPIMNNIGAKAKCAVLKDVLFEVFYKALILDESFKSEHRDQLKSLIDGYVDNNGEFNVITEAVEKSDSLLLKKIKSLCESIATEVCKRKMSECQNTDNNIDVVNFDMSEDETEKLNYGKNNIDIDQIAELVKNKVLTVIRDEKLKQEETANTIKEIEDDAKSAVEGEDITAEEAFERIIIQKPLVETSTLFNALFRSTYRDFIEENVAITSTDNHNIDEFKKKSVTYDTETEVDDVIDDSADDDEDIENAEIDNDIMIDNKNTVDMDLVLAETITKYTLMETLYTLKIEDYTTENMRKLTERLLNPVNESKTEKPKNEEKSSNNDRKEFFKYINKLKDLKDVDKTKSDLEKFYSKIDSDDRKKYFKTYITTAIDEFENIKEKNPNLAKQYDGIIEWLNELK